MERARGLGLIEPAPTAAIDSTGLETDHASQYFTNRRGKQAGLRQPDWPKLTLVRHTRSHLIAGMHTGRGPSHDSPAFAPAMRQAAALLRPSRLLADAGYDAEHNHRLCREELGIASTAIPLIVRPGAGPPRARYRKQMHARFPNRVYRQRSQAESAISRHKRLLGCHVSARGAASQARELRLRVLTHDLMILRSKQRVSTEHPEGRRASLTRDLQRCSRDHDSSAPPGPQESKLPLQGLKPLATVVRPPGGNAPLTRADA